MSEQEIKTEAKPEVEQKPVEQKEDLLTRVSQVKIEEKPKEEIDSKFNINDLDSEIEKIQDNNLKNQMSGLKKSLLKGENQKYQEIANLRKKYEDELAKATNWTPDRLKQELNRPDFVQAAQEVLQTNNQDYSALSDAEKTEITQLKQKLNMLEQSNWQSVKTQQDATLKTKYANYSPDVIDDVAKNLLSGKIQATREDLWKVVDYENAVKRAYELGKSDKVVFNEERINGMSYAGGHNMPQPSAMERQKGETIEQFMRRSYSEHTKKK